MASSVNLKIAAVKSSAFGSAKKQVTVASFGFDRNNCSLEWITRVFFVTEINLQEPSAKWRQKPWYLFFKKSNCDVSIWESRFNDTTQIILEQMESGGEQEREKDTDRFSRGILIGDRRHPSFSLFLPLHLDRQFRYWDIFASPPFPYKRNVSRKNCLEKIHLAGSPIKKRFLGRKMVSFFCWVQVCAVLTFSCQW